MEQFFLSLNLSSAAFLLLTQVIIFVLGWPLEWTEIIVIFVPIFLPLLDDFEVDPLFFGIMVALNIADLVPLAAGRDGGLLSEGRCPGLGQAYGYLRRLIAFRVHGLLHDGTGLHLPRARALAPELSLLAALSSADLARMMDVP